MIVTFLMAGMVILLFVSGALLSVLRSSDRRRGCVSEIRRNGDVQDSVSPLDEGDTTMNDLATRPVASSTDETPTHLTPQTLLATYGLDQSGKIIIPVDPVAIAHGMGAVVYDVELPSGVSGALIKRSNNATAVMLNERDSIVRRRFTCAHELGHFADRISSGEIGDDFEFVDRRDHKSSQGTDQRERSANRFAAELLMPEELVRNMARNDPSLPALAVAFGVSVEAMGNRLSNLKIATPR